MRAVSFWMPASLLISGGEYGFRMMRSSSAAMPATSGRERKNLSSEGDGSRTRVRLTGMPLVPGRDVDGGPRDVRVERDRDGGRQRIFGRDERAQERVQHRPD